MSLSIDKTWSLFLDRDGVINENNVGRTYVGSWEEFRFVPKALESIAHFNKLFNRIVVVTNQQGIGKGIMTEADLLKIHSKMMLEVERTNGRIDTIYFAPQRKEQNSQYRKPNMGMALQAQKDYPDIDFSKSIMIGDSPTDIEFGKQLGMVTIAVGDRIKKTDADYRFKDLGEVVEELF